jgi:hypothetical protein
MNLFAWIPNEHDATSFYRGLQPIVQLRWLLPNLQIQYAGKEIGMKDVAHQDVIFLQRPAGPEHIHLIEMAKALRIPVWADYDDDLFSVPSTNPAHQVFNNPRTQQVLNEIISKVDVLSVSTQCLADALSQRTKAPIYVIPNAFNDYLFRDEVTFKPKSVVTWRGTQSHQGDLFHFGPAIMSAAQEHPRWLFNFFGFNPWFITEQNKRQFIHTPPCEIIKYHQVIKQVGANVNIVTLSDTHFNRCKSNISFIEAAYAGGVTIAPNFPEWQRPGVITYNSMREFQDALKDTLATSPDELRRAHASSWEFIQEELLLSKVNKQRATLLKRIV